MAGLEPASASKVRSPNPNLESARAALLVAGVTRSWLVDCSSPPFKLSRTECLALAPSNGSTNGMN